MARVTAAIAQEIRQSGAPIAPPACVISGGETTVTLGGRAKAGGTRSLPWPQPWILLGWNAWWLSAGTDGTDGPTEAAGAIADGQTVLRARASGWSQNSFYGTMTRIIFAALGDLVLTGSHRDQRDGYPHTIDCLDRRRGDAMELGLRGKVAVVTGGSHGIGKATVLDFAREGCKVAFSARGDETLQATAQEVKALGAEGCR